MNSIKIILPNGALDGLAYVFVSNENRYYKYIHCKPKPFKRADRDILDAFFTRERNQIIIEN